MSDSLSSSSSTSTISSFYTDKSPAEIVVLSSDSEDEPVEVVLLSSDDENVTIHSHNDDCIPTYGFEIENALGIPEIAIFKESKVVASVMEEKVGKVVDKPEPSHVNAGSNDKLLSSLKIPVVTPIAHASLSPRTHFLK